MNLVFAIISFVIAGVFVGKFLSTGDYIFLTFVAMNWLAAALNIYAWRLRR